MNANFFSDVWTPPDLEPLVGDGVPAQSRIILAWSGFAWDANRGDLILYGGGHANYSGNDVYRWHSSTLQWERASLPSEIFDNPISGYQAIDGVDAAPSAAHTYVNNLFLPIADRFLTWGGSAYNNGGPYLRVSETDPTQTRFVGPYLFDPSRADGNKVGGTTGSHVMRVSPHPEVVGGQMWENRDIDLHLAGQDQPDGHTNGCAFAVTESNHDVVYVAGTNALTTDLDLYRYQLTDIANPAVDQIVKVGAYSVGNADQTTCGYDPARKLFVRTGTNAAPFTFWDLTTPDPNNLDQEVEVDATIGELQSWMTSQNVDMLSCAIEFDPVRQTFPFWCGTSTIWDLQPPPAANTASGWTVTQRPPPSSAPTADPNGTSVLGKWHYVPYYDVFIWLEDINEGNIWIYRPDGWIQPNPAGNLLPTVNIDSPADNTNVAPGTSLTLGAVAADPDGAIARVEFYVNGVKVGQATSLPYVMAFTPLFVGTYTVVAVAVDNVGGMAASVPVEFTVSAQLTTTTLQRGLNTYAGVTDTFLNAYDPGTPYGASSEFLLDPTNYVPLIRFAVFQSEGGSVPNGAVIQSAKLELYKQFYDDTLQLNALLRPWVESQATWNESETGIAWNASGAAGAGTDYDVAVDALAAGDLNPGWVAFDVTSRVQQWSTLSAVNYGWRLAQDSTNQDFKEFYSSEYSTDPTLRPKLTVVYAQPGKASTSTILASSANPSILGASVTFTATIHGSLPTGSVNFVDGALSITGCSAVALGGVGDTRTAQCATSGLTAASHSISAQYSGDGSNNGSTSTPLLQIVNPVGPAPATVTQVVSRKTHGAAGVFDLNLSLTPTDPTTEPRLGPAQTIVFRFDKPVVSGTATILEGTAVVSAVTFAGNEMTVSLSSADNQQYVTVVVSNVVASDGGSGGSGTVRIGYLAGDVNQNRVVTVADLVLVNSTLARPVTTLNYLNDINANGTLTFADIIIVNANGAKALPKP